MNRIPTKNIPNGANNFPLDPNSKDRTVSRLRFLDNYNLWLETRHEGQIVAIRFIGLGMGDARAEGIIKRVDEKRLIVEVMGRNGLRGVLEFWRMRTATEGFPRSGEIILEPHDQEKGLLAQRLMEQQAKAGLSDKEQEFEFDHTTGEMRRI